MTRALGALALALTLGGCVTATWWPLRPAAVLLSRADRAAEQLRYRDALRHYDDFLARFPDDPLAARALESRDTVAAVVTTREEQARLREELTRLRAELAVRETELGRLRDDVTKLRQELLTRQAESDRLRTDLERLKQIDLKMERRR
jgi:hypothetical protein